MSENGIFSDEYLNAFVDDQLALDERGRLYSQINTDETTHRRVCDLRMLQDLVRMAYKDLPPAPDNTPSQDTRRAQHWPRFSASAAAVLGVLVLAGGLQQDTGSAGLVSAVAAGQAAIALQAHATAAGPAARTAGTTVADSGVIKVLFSLNSGSPAHMKEVLDETQNLLNRYQRKHQKARVEVIANGNGLNLLLAGRSPYPARVVSMLKKYRNLQFAACMNTINQLDSEGIRTTLLPGTTVIDSGVAQIIRLQRRGWVYIQV